MPKTIDASQESESAQTGDKEYVEVVAEEATPVS